VNQACRFVTSLKDNNYPTPTKLITAVKLFTLIITSEVHQAYRFATSLKDNNYPTTT
jgi:hypothetical protein